MCMYILDRCSGNSGAQWLISLYITYCKLPGSTGECCLKIHFQGEDFWPLQASGYCSAKTTQCVGVAGVVCAGAVPVTSLFFFMYVH